VRPAGRTRGTTEVNTPTERSLLGRDGRHGPVGGAQVAGAGSRCQRCMRAVEPSVVEGYRYQWLFGSVGVGVNVTLSVALQLALTAEPVA